MAEEILEKCPRVKNLLEAYDIDHIIKLFKKLGLLKIGSFKEEALLSLEKSLREEAKKENSSSREIEDTEEY